MSKEAYHRFMKDEEERDNKQKAMVNQTFISSFVKKGSIPPMSNNKPNYEDSLDCYSQRETFPIQKKK